MHWRSAPVKIAAYTMAWSIVMADNDLTQPGILVRDVFNDERRAKLVHQVPGSWLGEVLEWAFHYWKNIDTDVGRRIEAKVRAASAPRPLVGERVPAKNTKSSRAKTRQIGPDIMYDTKAYSAASATAKLASTTTPCGINQ